MKRKLVDSFLSLMVIVNILLGIELLFRSPDGYQLIGIVCFGVAAYTYFKA